MPDITNLTGVGVAGLAVYLFWKLSSNHLKHNTIVLGELRDAIKQLIEFLTNRDLDFLEKQPKRRKR